VDSTLKDEIRWAVAAADFTRGRQLWERYAIECRDEMLHAADPRAVLEEAGKLMVWCRQMALAAWAQAQARLDNLAHRTRVAAAYARGDPPSASYRTVRY